MAYTTLKTFKKKNMKGKNTSRTTAVEKKWAGTKVLYIDNANFLLLSQAFFNAI